MLCKYSGGGGDAGKICAATKTGSANSGQDKETLTLTLTGTRGKSNLGVRARHWRNTNFLSIHLSDIKTTDPCSLYAREVQLLLL